MDRTAVITGGTGGLGAAVTTPFSTPAGASSCPIYEPASSSASGRTTRWSSSQADLSDPASVATVMATAGDSLRALVNLVGGFHAGGRVHETPIETFEAQLRLNLRPTYLACAAAIRRCSRRARAPSSASPRAPRCSRSPAAAGYATAKAAVLAFVDALHAEYNDDGIRTNAILPSIIDTPANRASMPDADASKWVAPEEIAQTILYLCSPDSSPLGGAHVPVYGRA